MCAVVDKSVFGELWDRGGKPTGQGFRKIVESGRLPLSFGGTKIKHEVAPPIPGKSSRMLVWIQQLQSAGRLIRVPDHEVDKRAHELASGVATASSQIRSNDHHVIALAQVSGARLLYTNDKRLTHDFGDLQIINSPRGRVYSTNETSNFNKQRRDLLARTDLCARGGRAVP